MAITYADVNSAPSATVDLLPIFSPGTLVFFCNQCSHQIGEFGWVMSKILIGIETRRHNENSSDRRILIFR
jgi:hypothetical protein